MGDEDDINDIWLNSIDREEDIWMYKSQLGNNSDIWKVFSQMNSASGNADAASPSKRYDYKTIAEKLMRELVANEIESHVLLKDDEIRDWWAGILREDKRRADEEAKKEAARIRRENDKKLKEAVLSRLTDDEKRVLGLKK